MSETLDRMAQMSVVVRVISAVVVPLLLQSSWRSDAFSSSVKKTNPRRRGLLRRITGDSTPYEFPVRPVSFETEWRFDEFPFTKYDFSRLDPYNDGIFYSLPRLVYHIDEPAVAALTQYYRRSIAKGSDILDICSSWVSHYPIEFPETMGRICATGMNALELALNDQLQQKPVAVGGSINSGGNRNRDGCYSVLDLNKNPNLPFDDASFDVITCAVSIDYLVDPVTVLKECNRVLRPGGKVIISCSNRCFGLKAVRVWLRMKFPDQIELINAYFQYAGGFGPRQAFDITAKLPRDQYQDPMFVVEATKL